MSFGLERRGDIYNRKFFLGEVGMLEYLEGVLYNKRTIVGNRPLKQGQEQLFVLEEGSKSRMYGMGACPVFFCIDLASGRTLLEYDDTNVIPEDCPRMPIIDFMKGGVGCKAYMREEATLIRLRA